MTLPTELRPGSAQPWPPLPAPPPRGGGVTFHLKGCFSRPSGLSHQPRDCGPEGKLPSQAKPPPPWPLLSPGSFFSAHPSVSPATPSSTTFLPRHLPTVPSLSQSLALHFPPRPLPRDPNFLPPMEPLHQLLKPPPPITCFRLLFFPSQTWRPPATHWGLPQPSSSSNPLCHQPANRPRAASLLSASSVPHGRVNSKSELKADLEAFRGEALPPALCR